jgi:hypothetical protein
MVITSKQVTSTVSSKNIITFVTVFSETIIPGILWVRIKNFNDSCITVTPPGMKILI